MSSEVLDINRNSVQVFPMHMFCCSFFTTHFHWLLVSDWAVIRSRPFSGPHSYLSVQFNFFPFFGLVFTSRHFKHPSNEPHLVIVCDLGSLWWKYFSHFIQSVNARSLSLLAPRAVDMALVTTFRKLSLFVIYLETYLGRLKHWLPTRVSIFYGHSVD